MKHNKTIKSYHKLSFLLALGLGFSVLTPVQANEKPSTTTIVVRLDSIGNEVINGERYVIHKLSSQETYYQLSRVYNVPVKDIMNVNKKKNLRVGDTVKIPRGRVVSLQQSFPNEKSSSKDKNKVLINPQDITEYKVSKNETLYAISKRFSISVDDIKKVNGLTSENLREGQILKIPNHSLPAPEPETPVIDEIPAIIEERQPIDDSMFKPNKYGIREKKERGVGVWMDSLTGDGQTSLALHKNAPIGTILKITNPMNRSVTFAKVVGKFGDNEETQDAIVVLSKSVATSIGALDRKFQVEITYGIPLE